MKTTAEKYPDSTIFPFQSNHSYSPSQVHLLGHSLGAHAAGEAGRKTPGLGRITGETRGPGPQVLSPVAPGHAVPLAVAELASLHREAPQKPVFVAGEAVALFPLLPPLCPHSSFLDLFLLCGSLSRTGHPGRRRARLR